MTMSEPRLRLLLRQAERTKEAGKRAAAAQLYRDIVAEAPQSSEAWLGLAALTADPGEQQQIYERVLALEPENKVAQAVLRGEPAPEPKAPTKPADKTGEVQTALDSSAEWLARATAPEKKPAARETAVSPPAADPNPPRETAVADDQILFCYRHPERETALRCYNCTQPICMVCANKTPVGYICPACRYEMEEKFFTAGMLDYLIAGAISFVLSLLAGFVVVSIGRGFFLILLVLFLGGAVGNFIAKLSNRAIGGRRGRYIPQLVAGMVIVGVAIPALPLLLALLSGAGGALFALLVPGIYAFVAASAAFYWMR
jgi:hypothetical protein